MSDYQYTRLTESVVCERDVRKKAVRFQESAGRLRAALDATLDAIADDLRRQHERAAAREEIAALARQPRRAS